MGVFSGVFGGSMELNGILWFNGEAAVISSWDRASWLECRSNYSQSGNQHCGKDRGGRRGLWKGRGGEFYQFWPLFCAAGSPALQYTSTVKQDHYCGLKEGWEGDSLVWKGLSLHATNAAFLLICRYEPWAQWTKICRTVLESSVPSTTHRTQGSPSSQISGVTRITHQRALGKISQFNKFNLYSQRSL